MRTIQDSLKLDIKINKDELLEKKWLNYQLLSNKLKEIEQQRGMEYKALRNRFYNSRACNKYNMKIVAGLPCIDVEEPMQGKASLELTFVME